ncbi:MAG TPA: ParB N-terminal domain-containing protein [Thermoplasmata archaeon]|jgi:ParB-like chromosome segregation protein Spo0J
MARAEVSSREKPAVRFELLDVGLLCCHEEIQPDLLERVMEEIREDGYVKKPILVADGAYVILDGHHRFAALRALGCRRIPCYVIDYFSEAVDLTLWPTAKVRQVTKQEVLRRGQSGELFTPKTTRHVLRLKLPDVFTDLEDLM